MQYPIVSNVLSISSYYICFGLQNTVSHDEVCVSETVSHARIVSKVLLFSS